MSPAATLTLYCLLILLASLAGGWLPLLVRLTHTRLQVATSFVSGLMLGVGLLHLLPHSYHQLGSLDRAAAWLLAGFVVMFLIQRFFHFHHHDVPEEAPEGSESCCSHHPSPAHAADEVAHDHTLADKSARHLSWVGAALGLGLHTLINGVALAASVEADARTGAAAALGVGTFLAIVLHKPFDALAIATLMAVGGWSRPWRHLVNAAFALVIPLGAGLFYLGLGQFTGSGQAYYGSALAFAAGTFVCIAASDLLPELQFHSHDRIKLTCALLAGLGLAVLVGRFESTGHDHHEHEPPSAARAPTAPSP
jgi:zinc and cadmium transporter